MKIFKITRRSSFVVSVALIFIDIIFASVLYQFITSYNADVMNWIIIINWLTLMFGIFVWCFTVMQLFIKLKSELKQLFHFNQLFYIMLLPLIILTLGIFGLVWSIKCNIKRSILDRGEISVSHKK